MEPTVGRLVHYRLSQHDVERLKAAGWTGNTHRAGDVVPMLVVRPWHQEGAYEKGVSCMNGQAFLDGPGQLWITSAKEGENPGEWSWMPYQKGQAAKTEELERKLAEK